ncbi:hypothetical protein PLICRDRAFT_279290 [Plicaturopsis crispa FD-325 SS-3]|nr:hypothetical protein PLICRDRAFT_279290 [Plicaturopsis crispa FD-325 SS-3]
MSSDTYDATSSERVERQSVAKPTEAQPPEKQPPDTARSDLEISHHRRTNISHLPNEMLINIFSEGPPEVLKGTLPFSITISHVSRYWRALALNTPSLWARIHTHPGYASAYPLPILTLFLARSRSHPLDILSGPYDDVRFMTALLPHAARWRSFIAQDINVDSARMLSPLYVPQLRRLCISPVARSDVSRLSQSWFNLERSPILLFAGGAPLLEELALDTFALLGYYHPATKENSYPNLKHFRAHKVAGDHLHLNTRALRAWLTHTPLLQTLTIQPWTQWDPNTSPTVDAPIALPALTRLEIHCRAELGTSHYRGYLAHVLCSLLATPALERLVLKGPGLPGQFDDLASVLQCRRLAYPRLRALTIDGSWPWPVRVQEDYSLEPLDIDEISDWPPPVIPAAFMRALPDIEDVEVAMGREPIVAFLRELEDGAVWPKLRRLDIGVRNREKGRELPDTTRTMTKRVEAGSPIVHFTLTDCREGDPSED